MTTQDLIAKLTVWWTDRPATTEKWRDEFKEILSQANQEDGRGERYPNGYCWICGKAQGTHFKPCPNPPTQELPAPQRQDSTQDQLRAVKDLARRAGCYDAADWITTMQGKTFSATVKEESLAAKLAFDKEYLYEVSSSGGFYWLIKLRPRTITQGSGADFYGHTYAEAEAKARQYLLDLKDSKGGERK